MKNKKLFAILTLVCFMFTLMPVAAFAADPYVWVEEDAEVVKLDKNGKAEVTFNASGINSADVVAFAMKNDSLSKDMTYAPTGDEDGFLQIKGLSKSFVATFVDSGEYTVYVVKAAAGSYEAQLIAKAGTEKSATAVAKELIAESDNLAIMENNVITVNPYATSYVLKAAVPGGTFYADTEEDKVGFAEVEATLTPSSNGAEEKTVWVELTNGGSPVAGQELTITTNSYGIEVNKETVKTDPNGVAKFKVSSTIAGDFKVYVEYGAKADLTLDVESDSTAPAYIETLYVPTTPVALDSNIAATDITFAISDINGNNVDNSPALVKGTDYTVKVVEAPKGSSVKAANIVLAYNDDNAVWYPAGVTLDAEGDYTFKVVLDNGHSATASITVKEFQTPVALKMIYKQNTVELDGRAVLNKLFYVDENGVTKSLLVKNEQGVLTGIKEVKLAANGYAVEYFDATKGNVRVKADEKYVGSKINVVAVSDKYNLTAVAELAVANEAASVKYASTDADVAVNNTLVANVVDADGNKVALRSVDKGLNISYIVLDKPADAKVAISTRTTGDLATKGEFKVSFTASEIGAYTVQTIVTYEQDKDVIKYYSGTETINVGNHGFEDIVVMSVGSNEIVKNAETAVIDAAPVVENNRTFVPFRALAEAFGATVAYDEATQAVTAELNGVTVVMTIGSAEYTVNGEAATADVAPFINGSRTMVPVRFVAEAFGIKVIPTYDENGATADILFNL